MLNDVFVELLAAAIVVALGWFFATGLWANAFSRVSAAFDSEVRDAGDNRGETFRRLLRMLLRDQSRFGRHRGQFGRLRSLGQGRAWAPPVERMFSRPRMYVTRWPCRVLKSHGLAPRALALAIAGVEALFENHMILGEEDTNPLAWRRRRFVNLRHTICAALILFEQKGWEQAHVKAVVGEMLSRGDRWRRRGGWLHSEAEPDSADLYSTLYAVQLLDAVTNCPDVSSDLAEAAEAVVQQSLVYLENEWKEHGWKYRALSAQESFPLAFIEVAEVLRRRRPELHDSVVDRLLAHRNPAGGLQSGYLAAVQDESDVSAECLLARNAYATYQALLPRSVWGPLRDAALAGNCGSLTAVEAAFLIDMEARDRAKPGGRDAGRDRPGEVDPGGGARRDDERIVCPPF
jgi:hypothetical protein